MSVYTSLFTIYDVPTLQCFFFNLPVFTYAYVTHQDIKQLGSLRDQTVIALKAPTETKLEVPDPDEVSLQAH